MDLQQLLADIHALEEELLAFERKYGIRSETFYAAYASDEEPEDYELFLYTLAEQFPSVRRSTVTFIRRGASLARVVGELYMADRSRVPA